MVLDGKYWCPWHCEQTKYPSANEDQVLIKSFWCIFVKQNDVLEIVFNSYDSLLVQSFINLLSVLSWSNLSFALQVPSSSPCLFCNAQLVFTTMFGIVVICLICDVLKFSYLLRIRTHHTNLIRFSITPSLCVCACDMTEQVEKVLLEGQMARSNWGWTKFRDR